MSTKYFPLSHKLIGPFIALNLLVPQVAFSTVKEVTLFPNSAQISETTKIRPQCSDNGRCIAVFTLPSQADPESVVVSAPINSPIKIEDLRVKSIARQDDARITDLRKQIAKLKEERKDFQARLQALDVQLQFWQMQTKAKTKNIADADNLSSAIGRNVRKASQEKFSVESELEKNEKRLKELQDNLNQITGKKETAYEAEVTFSSSNRSDVTFSYTYTLSGCGWLPLYRIEALPKENRISFAWDAQLWQSSGEDWKQVQINLATLQPIITVTPPELSPWIIKPRSRVLYKASRKENAAPMAAMEKLSRDEVQPETIEEIIKTTYSVWSLGKKNLPAGTRQRLKIKDELWPAEFVLLARPVISPQAFIRATIKLNKPVEIPKGSATFLIDGAILGKRDFALAGSESNLFFGTSPFISVTRTAVADKSGSKTFLQNKQTQVWQWLIEAKNTCSTNAQLRIEEPMPQSRDERIRLTFRQDPKPNEINQEIFIWIIDLPAGGKKSISSTIEMEAPRDMEIDLGKIN